MKYSDERREAILKKLLIWTRPVEQASHEMDTDEDCTLISGL